MTPGETVAWAGLAIGIVFGAAGRVSGFCLMSGLRGWWVQDDGRMVRAVALALAVALLGTQALEAASLVDLRRSVYMQPAFSPLLLAAGGALFGYGMVMSNGCGARALVLLGGGNLRSFVVIACIGIAGHITLTGLLAPSRALAQTVLTVQPAAPGLPGLLTAAGLPATASVWLPTLAISAALAAFAMLHEPFRRTAKLVAGGIVVGLTIVAGWYATGTLGADDFDPVPVASLSFIAPIGDTILYAMLSTGTALGFGVTVVAGIFVGSLLTALATGGFALEGFTSARAMARYMGGGTLMGVGGALALGCSIGQGLSGLSTLALTAFPAAAGILAGAALALRGPLRLPPPAP